MVCVIEIYYISIKRGEFCIDGGYYVLDLCKFVICLNYNLFLYWD